MVKFVAKGIVVFKSVVVIVVVVGEYVVALVESVAIVDEPLVVVVDLESVVLFVADMSAVGVLFVVVWIAGVPVEFNVSDVSSCGRIVDCCFGDVVTEAEASVEVIGFVVF